MMDTPARTNGPQPLPSPGDTVLGSFRLERQIGAGSFATAYLATQLGTDRSAVVKIPHPHLLHGPLGPELRRRFEAEAKAATRTKHTNLVTVYVVGDTQYGVPAIAMEHVVGESLHDRLTRAAPLAEHELAVLGSQLADALATLHAVGIVHRDLSPANVLLTGNPDRHDWVRLLDFGVAKLLDAPSRTLGPMGTPGYLAPEQLLGGVTARADVYSLGAVLWWGITGQEREDDFSNGALRASLGRRSGPDPRDVRADAPARLSELVARALIPEPRLRPSMAEFLLAWRSAVASPSADVSPSGVTQLQTPRTRSATPATRSATPATRSATPSATRSATHSTDPLDSLVGARVALVATNPSRRAQIAHYVRESSGVTPRCTTPRELGRASPGDFDLAIVDEDLADPVGSNSIEAAEFLAHVTDCYPELRVVVVSLDEPREATADGARERWRSAGAQAFLCLPEEVDALREQLDASGDTLTTCPRHPTSTVDPTPKLRRSWIGQMSAVAPQQLAASLEAFIGCVPEWIASIERGLDRLALQLAHTQADIEDPRRACRELVVGAESVGAISLATLAQATGERIDAADVGAARVFLAACEREYLEVFRAVFALLEQLADPLIDPFEAKDKP